MGLEYYERYWEHTSSDSSKERDRLTDDDGPGQGGEPIAAQTAVAQNKMFEHLKELFDQAGVDDWIAEIDHTVTYQSQKQQIMDRYGIRGFEADKERELEKLKEQQRQIRQEAPDDAPMSRRERMERDRCSGEETQLDDDAEVEIIGEPNESSQQSSSDDSQISLPSGFKIFLPDDGPKSSLNNVRKACTGSIEEVYDQATPTIIDALPGMGKTHGAIKAASRTETQITILVGRGNKGQYQEVKKWCQKYGLSNKILPSSYDDCSTINGDHGDKIAERQQEYIGYGLTVGTLHEFQDLPCEDGSQCPYRNAWDFDPANFDVIIGHYLHAYVPDIVENRTVVFDEFPGDTFVTELNREQYITEFLKECDEIPFKNYTDLLIDRNKNEKRSQAIDWFKNRGFELEQIAPVLFNDLGTRHALAPLGVLALLKTGELGNGWETGPLREGERAIFNREDNSIYLLRPPSLSQADGVVALSGTPVYRFWNLVLGLEFEVKRVLDNEGRRDYVWNVQGLQIIQTEREHVHPYSSGYHADPGRDIALIEEIHKKHGTVPTVITSQDALDQLKQANAQIDSDSTYYGNIRGSNKLQNKDAGLILGSPHPGDHEIEKWGAFFGEAVSRSGSGANLSYGPFGDKVLAHLRENEVLQAIFRFARDGSGATVYVNTAAIPSWLPRQLVIGLDRKRTENEKKVIEALSDLGKGSGPEIADEAGVSEDTTRDQLRRLSEEEVVKKTGKTRGVTWHDDGLSPINEQGSVDLTPWFTEPLYNIPIRDFHEKLGLKTSSLDGYDDIDLDHRDVEEGALAEQEKARRILEHEIEEFRNPP